MGSWHLTLAIAQASLPWTIQNPPLMYWWTCKGIIFAVRTEFPVQLTQCKDSCCFQWAQEWLITHTVHFFMVQEDSRHCCLCLAAPVKAKAHPSGLSEITCSEWQKIGLGVKTQRCFQSQLEYIFVCQSFHFEKFNTWKPQLLCDKREGNRERNKRSCERQWRVAIHLNDHLQQHAKVDSYSQI